MSKKPNSLTDLEDEVKDNDPFKGADTVDFANVSNDDFGEETLEEFNRRMNASGGSTDSFFDVNQYAPSFDDEEPTTSAVSEPIVEETLPIEEETETPIEESEPVEEETIPEEEPTTPVEEETPETSEPEPELEATSDSSTIEEDNTDLEETPVEEDSTEPEEELDPEEEKLLGDLSNEPEQGNDDEVVITTNASPEDDFFEDIPVDKDDPSSKLYKAFNSSFDSKVAKDPFAGFILSGLKGGKRTVYNKTIRETRIFERDYIQTIENAYPYICKIMRDPKKSIRYEEDVVQVEKARKVNSATIRHLASHTQLIKKIEKNGDVIPSKVLTTFAEEELAIYENRFIKSLVNRVDKFLERRHSLIEQNLESFQNDRIKVTNTFKLDKKDVSVTIDVSVRKEMEESMKVAQEIFDKLTLLRDQYRGLKSTDFMKELAKARPVLPPIMKTNIILHNPDFKIAYALWLFLDRYDGLGYDLDVKERTHPYTDELATDFDNLMAVSFATVLHDRRVGQFAFKKAPVKDILRKRPKVEKEIENEYSLKPGNYELEKNAINEFYLNETAKYFKNSLRQMQREGVGDTQSLRVVYKQMLEIIDNIYPSVFDARETQLEDVGETYTLEQRLEMVKRRQSVLRIVREQKELNLARMEKLEEKAKKEMLQIENKLSLAAERQRLREERERERQEKLLALAQEREAQRLKKEMEKAKKLEEIQHEKELQLLEKQKAKAKEEAKKQREKERNKVKSAERREKMKTSKRRNIRPRKRKMI